MQLNCGIVGLPNIGKTTIFSALTATPAETANYQFSTINPNMGVINVPDKRLDRLSEIINPKQTIPTTIEFVDIAGLVKGASMGEGIGNKFLGHIKQVGALIHVVRCFDDDNILHVEDTIDPIRDIETIEMELAFADMATVEKRLAALPKMLKSHDKKIVDKAKYVEPILNQILEMLNEGKPARLLNLDKDQLASVQDLFLITLKKQIFCCNIDDNSINKDNPYVNAVIEHGKAQDSDVIVICGKLEAEISEIESAEEKQQFLDEVGLAESGLNQLIRAGYHTLGLETFFTVGEKENRAWTFKKGSLAPQAAGVIHSDFERGFIKAEVYHCEDLFTLGSEAKIKEAGKMRLEGKEYKVKDGDCMHFRFNV